MSTFFSALNPLSEDSGISYSATGHQYSKAVQNKNLPDLTLDLVIPLLWHRNLSFLDGIYETFFVFYGDHFDYKARGVGQKGLLDFAILPLLARKLKADTYLEERKTAYLSNLFSLIIATPIQAISFTLALACTVALIPIIAVTTLLRWLLSPPPPPAAAAAMVMSTPTAFAALHVALHRLEVGGIRTPENVRRLLADPQNLALAYAMERITLVIDGDERQLMTNQQIFDFLLANRQYWTNAQVIENLDRNDLVNWHFPTLRALQNQVNRGINISQSTHTASVHSSTSKSALRLKNYYSFRETSNLVMDANDDLAEKIRNYDSKLVGERTNEEIVASIKSTINRLTQSQYIDPESSISLNGLLSYFHLAVEDPKNWREGVTKETAEVCFAVTLYEIDREYALSEDGEDRGYSGHQESCDGGAFNKLIEGMAKINKLCEVNFITPATAALRLPIVVRQIVKEHVERYPESLATLQEEGLSALWPQLQQSVLLVMNKEFASIYPPKASATIAHPGLVALVEAGEYTDITREIQQLVDKGLNSQELVPMLAC